MLKRLRYIWALSLGIFSLVAFGNCSESPNAKVMSEEPNLENVENIEGMDTITLGAGCFWCVEAIFQELEGVHKVIAGYANGTVKNPSYKEVCSGRTGHAEVAQVHYDPDKISIDEILEVFWQTHDPTTLNRQGADVGTQYRSGVYYHNEEQKEKAEHYKAKLNESGAFEDSVVTEIEPLKSFYEAENYHQDYYNNNSGEGYCKMVIRPKLEKFRKVFKEKLK